jgi:hypothetical protein
MLRFQKALASKFAKKHTGTFEKVAKKMIKTIYTLGQKFEKDSAGEKIYVFV